MRTPSRSSPLWLRHRPRPLPVLAASVAGLLLLPAVLPADVTGVLQSSTLPCRAIPCLLGGRGVYINTQSSSASVEINRDKGTIRLESLLGPSDAYPRCGKIVPRTQRDSATC